MEVTFKINDFGDEATSRQAVAAGRAPDEFYHLWGAILLEHPGQPTISVEDDLSTLGFALCADVPVQIEADGTAQLRLVGWPGEFDFAVQGTAVQVTGSQGERARFPRDPLLVELRACGRRLAQFMTELAIGSPQFDFSAQALTKALEKVS